MYRKSRNGFGGSQSSNTLSLASIENLGRNQMMADGTNVTFRIIRDAGTLVSEGWFDEGEGSGHFTLQPNEDFSEDLRNLGLRSISEEEQFQMAVHNISLDYIEDLQALGYDRLRVDKLLAMKDRGYDRLSTEDLVAMRIHGVKPDYVDVMQA